MKKIIKLMNVSKKVDYQNNEVTLLKNINFTVNEGEFVCIMGASGAGKSTLLNCIGGLDTINDGTVSILDNTLSDLPKNDLLNLRLEKIGFIFQQPFLLKNFNIFENICLPGYYLKNSNKYAINDTANLLMEKADIEHLKYKNIAQISGGEAQRTSICRALINNPELILADEPTGALNSKLTKEIMDLITNINKENKTIVMVTHDIKVALRSDKIYYIHDGTLKDCINLGKYNPDDEHMVNRNKELTTWLSKLGY